MERQLQLNLRSPSEQIASALEYLRPVDLEPRHAAAIALVIGCGSVIQVQDTQAVLWQASRAEVDRNAVQYGLDISGNTFLRRLNELEGRRIAGVLKTTRPWSYVVNLQALAALPLRSTDPTATLAALPCFGGVSESDPPVEAEISTNLEKFGQRRSTSVKVGQTARVRDRVYIQNPCPTVTRVRERDTGGVPAVGLAGRLVRPWDVRSGLGDADLVQSVQSGDLEPVRRLWREAVVLEWVPAQPCDDDLLRFLTIVHHCATCRGLNRRMGALVARVKRGLDVRRIPNGQPGSSEDWAAGVMRIAASGRMAELQEQGS